LRTAYAIKAVIFDLGRVLIDFDHGIAAKKAAACCDKTPKEIFDFLFDSQLTVLFEEGKISSPDFFHKVKEGLNLNLSYEGFLPIWNEIFFQTEDNRAVYDLVKSLKWPYKLVLLSNINELHFKYLKSKFPLFGHFHHVLLSFEINSIKPEPLIYKRALEILGLLPQEVFYTDDRQELIQAARSLGIQGFVFRTAAQLKKDLFNAGVKTL
jgi:putative hydrolase of the HAD superfamily